VSAYLFSISVRSWRMMARSSWFLIVCAIIFHSSSSSTSSTSSLPLLWQFLASSQSQSTSSSTSPAAPSSPSSQISLLQIGDWGGKAKPPFATYAQIVTADGMNIVAKNTSASGVLTLGDNFYFDGISGEGINSTCFSHRFASTFEDVYLFKDHPFLKIPFYVVAGNHDYHGNVSAEIEYSRVSPQNLWVFPHTYHKHSFVSQDGSVTVDVILIDTVTYTGKGDVGYSVPNDFAVQQAWLERSLAQSKAQYLLVGGHYPVYSVCDHGNNVFLIENLKPLLEKYGAHYFSGHDHCAEHLLDNSVNYWLNGMGRGCCYDITKVAGVPSGSLLWVFGAPPGSQIDDDGVEQGINGTVGSFTSIVATSSALQVTFYNQNGKVLYASPAVLPRGDSVPSPSPSSSFFDDSKNVLWVSFVVIIAVGGCAVLGYRHRRSKHAQSGNALQQQQQENLKDSLLTTTSNSAIQNEGEGEGESNNRIPSSSTAVQ